MLLYGQKKKLRNASLWDAFPCLGRVRLWRPILLREFNIYLKVACEYEA